MLLEGMHEVMQLGDVCGVSGLLALHRGDDDLVAELQFGHIGCLVRLGFCELEALSEEVIENFFLNRLCVGLLVGDPTGQLVGIFGRVLGEFDDLLGSFLDCLKVRVHGLDDIVIIIDAAGDLAVS